jgi:MOSC domain-containing protein YiiM
VEQRAAGAVRAVGITAAAGAPLRLVDEAHAVAGRGLEGDRYSTGDGTFSHLGGTGRHLTLIESEALESLPPEVRIGFTEARRNVLTSGIDLNSLVGRRFVVGEIECEGMRLCDPCAHLQRVTKPGVLRALAGKGGLRADILAGGIIRVGDEIRPL